jgi:hypothetical protein
LGGRGGGTRPQFRPIGDWASAVVVAASRRRKLPKTTITLNHVEPRFGPMTLRFAQDAIERAGGKLEVRDGGLFVGVPSLSAHLVSCARYLYLGEAAVIASLKSRKRLPDVQLTPSGRPVP